MQAIIVVIFEDGTCLGTIMFALVDHLNSFVQETHVVHHAFVFFFQGHTFDTFFLRVFKLSPYAVQVSIGSRGGCCQQRH